MKRYHACGSARHRKFRLSLLLMSVVFIVVAMALSGSSRKIKIMPLGDSITGSFANMASYRFWLWQQLVLSGYADKIEFVGTRCGTGDQDAGDGCGTPLYSCDVWSCKHNGIHDKTTGDILQRVPDFMRQDTADIVLLHVGTNDVTSGQTRMNTAKSNIGAIIDSMRAVNPNVTVLLCKIIPANEGQSATDSLRRLNDLIGQLATEKNTQCSPVIMVDQYSGFTLSDLQPDGVHPLVSGEKKIANKFFAALIPMLRSIDAISSRILTSADEARISSGASATLNVRAGAYPCVRDVALVRDTVVLGHAARQSDSLFSFNFVAPGPGFYQVKAIVSDYCGRTDTSQTLLVGVASNDNAAQLTIPQIQGPDPISPRGDSLVKTNGVVTAVCKDSSGFWMQDTIGDGNPLTSDAIFVSRSGSVSLPSKGDFVSVNGIVRNYQPSSKDAPTTRLSCVDSVTVISVGNRLPYAPVIYSIPNDAGDIPTVHSAFFPYEGMMVKFGSAAIVSPAAQPAFLPRGNLKNTTGFYMSTRVANVVSPASGSVDYNPAVMLLGSKTMGLLQVRAQDTLFSLTGVVDYDKGLLYIQPIPESTAVSSSAAPASPVAKRTWNAGTYRISTFDLGGFFDTIDTWGKNDSVMTGAAYKIKLTKMKKAVVQELLMPAVLCVQNVENSRILADLASSVNSQGGKYKSATGRKYLGFSIDTPSSPDPRGLINGFLYDTTQIAFDSAVVMSGEVVDSAFGKYSPLPTAQPLIGMFKVKGAALAIVNVTLVDKSLDTAYFCETWPFSERSKLVRKKQAAAVRKWINARLTAVPSLYMIVAGEFNDYPFAEPLDGADYPVAIAVGNAAKGETVFINAYDSLSPDARYTCIVNGRAQMTEQLMMNPKLASRAIWGDVLHFNANYEGSFISDSTTAIRCSGHDPIEVRF